jgi:hypothetical protein
MAETGQQASSVARNRLGLGLIVSGIITILTLGTAFGLLAVGVEFFWIAFPVGFGGVLPMALGFVALSAGRSPATW